jgi:hypothetical protein
MRGLSSPLSVSGSLPALFGMADDRRRRSHANKGQRGGAQRFVVPRAGGCEYQFKGACRGEACRSQSGGTQLHAGRGWDGCVGKSLSIGTASRKLGFALPSLPSHGPMETAERENHDGMGVRALVSRGRLTARTFLRVLCC